MVVTPERCTRCRICELVCSFAKSGEYNPQKSLIKILSNKELNLNIPVLRVSCDLCGGEERCVHSCPTGVLQFVTFDEAMLMRKDVKLGRFPAPLTSLPGPEGE